jgi:hypothetical protein
MCFILARRKALGASKSRGTGTGVIRYRETMA